MTRAKIGVDQQESECSGRFGRGHRNSNSHQLAEFCTAQNLILANTFFQHRPCYRTTWQGTRLDTATGEKFPIYNQIDYILAPKKQVNLLLNARSYSDTLVNSDHRIVIATTVISPTYKLSINQNHEKTEKIGKNW